MVNASPANFVGTVLRVTGVLGLVHAVSNAATAIATPIWQNVAMTGTSLIMLGAIAVAGRTYRRGEPALALERLYLGIFAAVGASVPLVYGTQTLVAIGLAVFVLSTAPPVLPLAKVDRWAQGTIAYGLLCSVFDVVHLPSQRLAAGSPNFTPLVLVALAIFALLTARNFWRFPVKTKLTLAILGAAILPLIIASYLRPLPPGASATSGHLLILAVAAGASLFAFALGHLLARPLSSVAHAMGRFTRGEIDARAVVRVADEIGEVAARFNVLAEELGRLIGSLREEVAQRTQREIELQAVNAALAAARDQATAANRAKSVFLAQMSHELRTPLNAIIGYTEMIADEAREPVVGDATGRVLFAAHHLLGIISDILDLSKIEAGRLDLALEEVDAVAIAQDACTTVQALMKRRTNTLHFVPEAPRLTLRADALKLRQVLLNLLSNATKFSYGGQVWCEVRGEPSVAPESIVVSIRDEGIGIRPDQLSILFRPFTQVDSQPTRRFDGTGLGLAISRHFCEAMGGQISVQSTPGVGSTFTVRLPIAGISPT